jgi:hypothetical protein
VGANFRACSTGSSATVGMSIDCKSVQCAERIRRRRATKSAYKNWHSLREKPGLSHSVAWQEHRLL